MRKVNNNFSFLASYTNGANEMFNLPDVYVWNENYNKMISYSLAYQNNLEIGKKYELLDIAGNDINGSPIGEFVEVEN